MAQEASKCGVEDNPFPLLLPPWSPTLEDGGQVVPVKGLVTGSPGWLG